MLHKMIRLLLFTSTITSILANDLTIEEKWNTFKVINKKSYSSLLEERLRYEIFQNNLKKIEAHNDQYIRGKTSWYMGINQFTDMTHEEFKKSLTLNNLVGNSEIDTKILQPPFGVKIPRELNWVEKGAVTPVKNQGTCGSCWSFSATGALEGQYFIKHKKLISLSEQNLIDCTSAYGNLGCSGGYMDWAFEYVRDNGIMTEESYPYSQTLNSLCHYNSSQSVLKISSFVDLRIGSEAQLQMATATIGPVSIGINADYFYSYAGGILDVGDCANDNDSINHGVLVVGYGFYNSTPYWLVKNSWGISWGENGYIRIARNKNNMCGLATLASYPLIN